MKPFKTYFLGWNIFEIAFLALCLIVPTAIGLLLGAGAMHIIAAIAFLSGSVFQAKGKVKGYLIAGISFILLAIISLRLSLYGEIIVHLGISFPIMVFGFLSWIRNSRRDKKKGEVVMVRRIKPKEFALVFASQLVMGFGYYFLLHAFGTSFLVASTVSIMANVFGEYLMARRCHLGTGVFVLSNIAGIVLWSLVFAGGETTAVLFIVMYAMTMINDLYGVWEWKRLAKRQRSVL